MVSNSLCFIFMFCFLLLLSLFQIKEHDLVGQGVITSIGATPTASRPASKEEYRHIDEIHPVRIVLSLI
jgi:hypothetical protein